MQFFLYGYYFLMNDSLYHFKAMWGKLFLKSSIGAYNDNDNDN